MEEKCACKFEGKVGDGREESVEKWVAPSFRRRLKSGKGHMEREDRQFIQMREYSRVDATIPLEVRIVPEDERGGLRSRTSMETVTKDLQQLPELPDTELSECLRIINAKLDAIMGMLSFQTRECCSLQLTCVNISAGGLRTVLHEEYGTGDLVEVKMMFPTLPYVLFYVYGDVLRSEKLDDGRYQICIEFTAIDEEIRDKIAKFVFEKQREILRMKRRQ